MPPEIETPKNKEKIETLKQRNKRKDALSRAEIALDTIGTITD